ncbi:hypothetical protein [Companilactobacillus alimentarius]|uniref:hypothetical protein n=1 Tax=Companilactobacillus alimentarius TaxID=1602 RepID=UPI0028B9DB71|nr:hypothetical protein [Companilactobacillus alimentarius]MDT6953226.1 hypothetical protein [Companilactobacillus alimentarius]
MVNVIDNGARNRTNMMPVGIKIIDNKGDVAHTAKTDLDTNYISLESKWFGSSSNNTGGGTGGNTGGGSTGGNTGGNYHDDSLADGEITQRNFEWGGTDDPTKSNTITFKDAQGSKFNGNYDGIQLLGHIQKTVITNGVAGTVTDLPLNFDVKNVVKSGCYTTSASYPIYINNSSINVGSVASVPIIGTGENLGGKNIKAPSISLTLNADMTLTLTHDKGYNNDGASPATGVEYQFIVDTISTYSVQKPVSQLPVNMTLANGEFMDDVTLSGVGPFFENIDNGLEIDVDPYIYDDTKGNLGHQRVLLSDINLPTKYFLAKEDLINSNNTSFIPSTYDISKITNTIKFYNLGESGWNTAVTPSPDFVPVSVEKSFINVGLGKITFNDAINFRYSGNYGQDTSVIWKYKFKILTVKTWKGE